MFLFVISYLASRKGTIPSRRLTYCYRLQEVPVPYLHMGLELLGDTDMEVVELDAFRAVEEGCPICG